MLNAIDNLGLRMNVIAKVTRNLQLERNILQRPALIVARRHTAHPNYTLGMAPANPPFGLRGRRRQVLRGRKRSTLNIVVRAAQPSVDGRFLATAQAPPTLKPLPSPQRPQPSTPPNFVSKKKTLYQQNQKVCQTIASMPNGTAFNFSVITAIVIISITAIIAITAFITNCD